ncbi:hypothetical protein FUA23_16680 [Neolewinella aurantiaca]|uniref:Response regulatory domain-containing protein n=1 Tax=Neolewinella aurantiaca TaxID=2602767 RepID=A0A5C7FBB9_9BACT|nr:response regulator [Neolewinella aurantiaca]TXF87995.1 hypothetical protein FUA23_16680 [Neolewinella aurantiaca]
MPNQKPRILIVEDRESDYRTLSSDLTDLGFIPSPQIKCLTEFLRYQSPYDLAIIDMELKGSRNNRDGIAVIKALKGKVPIIIHTIFGEEIIYNQIEPHHHVTEIMKPGNRMGWHARIPRMLIRFHGSAAYKQFALNLTPTNAIRIQQSLFRGFAVPRGPGKGKAVLPPDSISYIETRAQNAKGKVFFISDHGAFSRTGTLTNIMNNSRAAANLLQINNSCVINHNRIIGFSKETIEVSIDKNRYGVGWKKLRVGRSFLDDVRDLIRGLG